MYFEDGAEFDAFLSAVTTARKVASEKFKV
jgi:hypothetical protein